MGTVFQIPWTFLGNDTWPADGMHRLKELGYKNVAMALTDRSVSIDDEALMSEDKTCDHPWNRRRWFMSGND